eukprot:gene7085-9669_t
MASIFGGIISLYLSGALASSAGVGGGSLNVPIFINIFGFSYETATILSLCTLMGNYGFQVLINIDKSHPSMLAKPLIYWDAVMILLPAEIGGSNIGVIIESIFPDTIIYIFALIVLIIAGTFSYNKAIHLYEEETLRLYDSNVQSESDANLPLLTQGNNNNFGTNHSNNNDNSNNETKPVEEKELLSSQNNDKVQPSLTKILLSLIPKYLKCFNKKDRNFDSNISIDNDDIIYPWIIIGLLYPMLIGEIIWGFYYLISIQTYYPGSIAEGDIIWSPKMMYMPVFAFLVGILSSLLGIGGGELIGPLLLLHKVREIPYGWGLLVFFIGALSGITGRISALAFSAYYGRTSYMVFSLVGILIISFGIYVDYLFSDTKDLSFGSLCG